MPKSNHHACCLAAGPLLDMLELKDVGLHCMYMSLAEAIPGRGDVDTQCSLACAQR